MPNAAPILEMRQVSKRYGGVTALNTVDFAAYPGEIHAVLGENGAGKSTLIKIASGVTDPSEGELWIEGRKVAWTGDANNVLASWIQAAARLEFKLKIATPPELTPEPELMTWAGREGAQIVLTQDPFEAVDGADAVVTDCWVSMGDEDEGRRHNLLKPYQVNAKLMAAAGREAIFMHCLPAHRGEEVTDEVIDGPRSVVFDEAENRLHAQKGILAWCLAVAEA